MKNNIAILGAGSWGTTLAVLLAKKFQNSEIKLWEFLEDRAEKLNIDRENKTYLPGISISKNIVISSSIDKITKDADIIVLAVPSHVFREVLKKITIYSDKTIFVSVTKGIENKSLLRMSEIIKEELKTDNIVALSGPSHAEEVSRDIPTAVVVASKNIEIANKVQDLFMTNYFRIYTNTDIVGVEMGGALKNIIAIGAGILDGLNLGDNTKAALITRGLAEITRFGTFFGANPLTFSGLSGIGDLVVTCTSKHSRNRHLGEKIGKGKTISGALQEMIMVAEGVKTTSSVYELAKKNNITMPITNEMYEVLYQGKSPTVALSSLMTREARYELDDLK